MKNNMKSFKNLSQIDKSAFCYIIKCLAERSEAENLNNILNLLDLPNERIEKLISIGITLNFIIYDIYPGDFQSRSHVKIWATKLGEDFVWGP